MGTNQKLTAKQKSDRIKAAQERERKDKERREAAEKTKKLFTIVICVILVLALGIPTVALAFFGDRLVGAGFRVVRMKAGRTHVRSPRAFFGVGACVRAAGVGRFRFRACGAYVASWVRVPGASSVRASRDFMTSIVAAAAITVLVVPGTPRCRGVLAHFLLPSRLLCLTRARL